MNENEKLQKELEVLRDSMKDLEAMKKDYERMRYELVALKSAGMNGNNSANGFKQIQDERDRILRFASLVRFSSVLLLASSFYHGSSKLSLVLLFPSNFVSSLSSISILLPTLLFLSPSSFLLSLTPSPSHSSFSTH